MFVLKGSTHGDVIFEFPSFDSLTDGLFVWVVFQTFQLNFKIIDSLCHCNEFLKGFLSIFERKILQSRRKKTTFSLSYGRVRLD